MSGSSFDIQPGPPVQLSGANFANGTTIYNNDSKNSVWIANTQSVSPGNGFQVPALGSVSWQAQNNSNPWCCVDTGVETSVNITVSNDATNPQNPLGTALAVIEQGVPNVLVTKNVFDGDVQFLTTVGPLDISEFASITFYANQANEFFTDTPTTFIIQQQSSNSGITFPIISSEEVIILGPNSAYTMAVSDQFLVIQNISQNSGGDYSNIALRIMGSNRIAPRLDVRNYTSYGERYELTDTFSAVGAYNLAVPVTNNPYIDYALNNTQLQGQCSLEFHINDDALKGDLICVLAVPNGPINTQSFNYLMTTDTDLQPFGEGGMGTIKTISIPPAFHTFIFQVTTPSTSGDPITVRANIIPSLIS